MRIFSNFDTKLKKRSYVRYKKEFGQENVVLLSKSLLFGVLKFYLPFCVFLFCFLIVFVFLLVFWGGDGIMYFGLPVFLVALLSVIRPLLRNYIEYKMDFSIVTPKHLITYDQQGVFKRYIKTINAENIRTITILREGFFYSFFNNGDLTFLSEGGDVENGEIILHYIHKPEKKRHMIVQVLGKK